MNKSIVIGLSPNTQRDDVMKALSLLCFPWRFIQGEYVSQLERWFKSYFNTSYAIAFNSGRSALYALLHALEIGENDEVIMQAFTCTVVANSILANGAKPIYVDINSQLTLDVEDVEKKITKNTKAIIIQHTFGIPANLDKLLTVAKKYKLFVIEDVAHSIGGKYHKKKLGKFGDAAFFSFGRDKAFSSVWGGMAITNNKSLGSKIRLYQRQRDTHSIGFVYQQLLHPFITSFALSLYDFLSLGKIIIVLSQKMRLLSFPVSTIEKKGMFHPREVKKMPNALAQLALHQLKKIEQYNKKRQQFASIYQLLLPKEICLNFEKNIYFLRFPILIEHPEKLINVLRKKLHIYGGSWYSNVMDPKGSDFTTIRYIPGSCPKAEEVASHIVNLPTMPILEKESIELIAKEVKTYVIH